MLNSSQSEERLHCEFWRESNWHQHWSGFWVGLLLTNLCGYLAIFDENCQNVFSALSYMYQVAIIFSVKLSILAKMTWSQANWNMELWTLIKVAKDKMSNGNCSILLELISVCSWERKKTPFYIPPSSTMVEMTMMTMVNHGWNDHG